jgi:hypothetical protein
LAERLKPGMHPSSSALSQPSGRMVSVILIPIQTNSGAYSLVRGTQLSQGPERIGYLTSPRKGATTRQNENPGNSGPHRC